MPRREKRRRSPVGRLHVLSQVPTHPRTAAKVRGFSRRASDFTAETDCLLEEAGFEPSVPLAKAWVSQSGAAIGGRKGDLETAKDLCGTEGSTHREV
jgi:hypothetical protein